MPDNPQWRDLGDPIPTMADITADLIKARARWDARASLHNYWSTEELQARHGLDTLIAHLTDLGG